MKVERFTGPREHARRETVEVNDSASALRCTRCLNLLALKPCRQCAEKMQVRMKGNRRLYCGGACKSKAYRERCKTEQS